MRDEPVRYWGSRKSRKEDSKSDRRMWAKKHILLEDVPFDLRCVHQDYHDKRTAQGMRFAFCEGSVLHCLVCGEYECERDQKLCSLGEEYVY